MLMDNSITEWLEELNQGRSETDKVNLKLNSLKNNNNQPQQKQ